MYAHDALESTPDLFADQGSQASACTDGSRNLMYDFDGQTVSINQTTAPLGPVPPFANVGSMQYNARGAPVRE